MIHQKKTCPLYIYIENFKNHLVRNHWTDFKYILAEMFLWWPSTKIIQVIVIHQKTWLPGVGLIFPIYLYRKLKKSSCQKPMNRFQYNLARIFLWWPSTKIVQAVMIPQKNMAARGWALFSLYIYIEKFKNLLVRNSWTEFNVTWQECCFGDLLPRWFKLSWYVKKHGPQGAGFISHLYLYRKL